MIHQKTRNATHLHKVQPHFAAYLNFCHSLGDGLEEVYHLVIRLGKVRKMAENAKTAENTIHSEFSHPVLWVALGTRVPKHK